MMAYIFHRSVAIGSKANHPTTAAELRTFATSQSARPKTFSPNLQQQTPVIQISNEERAAVTSYLKQLKASSGQNTLQLTQAKRLLVNKSNSLTSEAIVKQRLTSQLGADEAILDKPRIYIGDGNSGKYAQPDFAIYNRATGRIVKLVDAKDGNATLTRAQQQINQYGGIFRGSSRDPAVVPQRVAPNPEAIQIERTSVALSNN